MKEKRNFFVRLVIEGKNDGKIVSLSKHQKLEIDFEGSEGKIVGKKKNEVVLEFEKDGKKYQVLMRINKIKKGWFKDEIIGCVFNPLPEQEWKLYENDTFYTRTRYGTEERYKHNVIKPTQWRKSGFVLIALISSIVIIIIVVAIWRQKKDLKR